MKRKTTNSPYPVLYPFGVDYLPEQGYTGQTVGFDLCGDPEVSVDKSSHDIRIRFDFDLREPTLEELVARGDAKYYVNVECGSTYYREAAVQSEKQFELVIPYQKISGKLEIFAGLTAAKDLPGFHAAGFSDKFGNNSFDIEEGDILAAATGWDVELEELDGDMSPYIYVARDDSEEVRNELWVDGSGDTLVVYLAKSVYDIYFNRARDGRYKDLIIALVMKPAILSALQRECLRAHHGGIEEDQEPLDTQGKRWLRKLDGLIARVMGDILPGWTLGDAQMDEDRGTNTLAFAVCKLLGQPLSKAMAAINKKV